MMVDPGLHQTGNTFSFVPLQSKTKFVEVVMVVVVQTFCERYLEVSFQGCLNGQSVLDRVNSHLSNLVVPLVGHLQAWGFSHPLLLLFLVVACAEVLSCRART